MESSKKDLFEGTSEHYSKYRDEYRQELIGSVVSEFKLDGRGKLLDLGCGTGRIAILLHKYFEKVTGIDISSDMLKEAKNESVKLGISNIEWLNMPAESISEEVGVFKLITCGEALHWMDRETVINKCYKVITPGGGFVVLGAGGSIAKGKEKWQEVLRETIEKWIKTSENKPKWKSKEYKPHEEIIRESKFEKVEQRIFKYKKTYKIEEILGFLYTTSYCNKNLLGEKLAAFEKDLIDRLIDINSIGIFEEEREAYYIIGRKF